MPYTEGPRNIFLNGLLEWHSRHALDDVAGQICAIIRISWNGAGSINMVWLVSTYERLQHRQLIWSVNRQVFDDFLKPRRVGHEVAHRHGTTESVRHLKIEVIIHVCV